MSELPAGWSYARLGQLLHSIEAGLNVKCEERAPGENEAGLVKISAVTWGVFDEYQSKTLPFAMQPNERNRIRKGDLLISRANTIELVGACVIVGQVQRRLYLSDKVLRLLVHEPSKHWINYALKTPQIRKAIQSSSTGNQLSMRNIPQDKLRALEIPLAPEPEQQRITDQLDTLLTRVQACNDRFDAIPALLKRFRQTVLDAGLSGALLDIDSETAIESDVPKVSISAIAAVGTGSTPLRSNSQFFASTGTPWVTSSATSNALITTAYEFVTSAAVSAHRLKLYPKDTLLVAMYGEGKTRGQVAELGIDATINQACAAIVVDKTKALTAYVKLALQANYLSMRELAEGGNQPNLNLSKVKEFEIPLPSLAVQTKIVHRVQAFFTLADRIEARCTAARAQAQRLTPLVLAKAFRGELVPQDLNDEPASALLARITSSNTAVAGKSKLKVPIAPMEPAQTAINL